MMRCRICYQQAKVTDAYLTTSGDRHRRRQCVECGHRFTTRERVIIPEEDIVTHRSGPRPGRDRKVALAP